MANTPPKELTEQARAYAEVMGRQFIDAASHAPGAWLLERTTDAGGRPRWGLVQQTAVGRQYITPDALTARELEHALRFARIAVGIERTGAPAHQLGYPYRGEAAARS